MSASDMHPDCVPGVDTGAAHRKYAKTERMGEVSEKMKKTFVLNGEICTDYPEAGGMYIGESSVPEIVQDFIHATVEQNGTKIPFVRDDASSRPHVEAEIIVRINKIDPPAGDKGGIE